MKHSTPLGSRIAMFIMGRPSLLVTPGRAKAISAVGSLRMTGWSRLSRYLKNMFYNTGIATYIWVLTNRKGVTRKGKVQLIDASEWFVPLRKNLGNKNCELSEEHIKQICELVVHPIQTEKSKIFSNEAFGYWKVTV